jgi:hypothetical protein
MMPARMGNYVRPDRCQYDQSRRYLWIQKSASNINYLGLFLRSYFVRGAGRRKWYKA